MTSNGHDSPAKKVDQPFQEDLARELYGASLHPEDRGKRAAAEKELLRHNRGGLDSLSVVRRLIDHAVLLRELPTAIRLIANFLRWLHTHQRLGKGSITA